MNPRTARTAVVLAISLLAAGTGLAQASTSTGGSVHHPGHRLPGCPAHYAGYLAGAARTDITPVDWPVAEAAYSIGRTATGATHPFYASSLALRSCPSGATVVITSLDSQGYFAGYKEDPGSGAAGYGTAGIRLTVQSDTGLPAADMLIATTHTHNSPDSIGIWGGAVTANNKAPYLSLVKTRTVSAIEQALAALRPARLFAGSADISALQRTEAQVAGDPADYPIDHTLHAVQVVDARTCAPISTVVEASVHATVAGTVDNLIDPDWPGYLADDLQAALPGETPVVFAGAVGRTQPQFPAGTYPSGSPSGIDLARAYAAVLDRRVNTALSSAQPIPTGPVAATDTTLREEVAEPAMTALFVDEAGTPAVYGLMRSMQPPFADGDFVMAEVQTLRLGGLMVASVPGEPYPEVATEVAGRVQAPAGVVTVGLGNDQLGYLPPAFEYPVVALVDGGDEGIFTINAHYGDDVINTELTQAAQLGFPTTAGSYDGVTAGPVVPPGQLTPTASPVLPEPTETPLAVPC